MELGIIIEGCTKLPATESEINVNENLKEIMECASPLEENLPSLSDVKDGKGILNADDATKENNYEAEKEKTALDQNEDDDGGQIKMNLNVREIHESSPIRQAIRGFVLSKLSKKVGSSHVLSGLTEKIVKKLEEKDAPQPAAVTSSESDVSISSSKTSESAEALSSSISCELKSVVANDLGIPDVVNIESATECVEEAESLVDNTDSGLCIPQRAEFRSNSISLPSSPAHGLMKRASSVSSSLENVQMTRKNSDLHSLTFLCDNSKSNTRKTEPGTSKPEEEIELKDIKKKNSNSDSKKHSDLKISYPCNMYSSVKEDDKSTFRKILKKSILLFFAIKSIFTSLSLSHIFLLACIIIHNMSMISSYVAFVFDGIIIGYLCYSYICVLIQKPAPSKTANFPFVDPQLEHASIHTQKTNRLVKGSVKVLKGEYDPEMVKNHPTDLVDISIENCCLKVYTPKKKNKEASTKSDSFTFYDLLGASVTLVPSNLSRKRIWNKKYPICITLSVTTKAISHESGLNDPDLHSMDYLSVVKTESNFIGKALYFFALTDREKETLFWALLRNTIEENDFKVKSNVQPCDTSSKIDFNSLSYTSLLELSSDDSISQNKDSYEDDVSDLVDKTNSELDFECYVRNLFENYDRMNRFSSRSRSFEDLSNPKEDISKSFDSLLSKDDSFLSSSRREYSVDWLNLAIGRVFYDFLTQKHWSDYVKAKIQKKLSKIEMPTFIESLEVSDVFLGSSLPQIHTVSSPISDVSGVWFNFDFNYCGSFQMTLKAKLSMTKAKQLPGAESIELTDGKQNLIAQLSESSDEESAVEKKITSAKQKRLLHRIERWISHRHFQAVAQSSFVKKYVGDLSNISLTLTVEVNSLHGTLNLNIPPAPTDRIWYGFKKDPVLNLNAYPKVGTHEINLSAVVQMIEKKLIQEFKKALVMPNMDDLLIPVMYSPIYEF